MVGFPPRRRKEVNAAPVKVTVVVGETEDAIISSTVYKHKVLIRIRPYSDKRVKTVDGSRNWVEMCGGFTTRPAHSIAVFSKGVTRVRLKKQKRASLSQMTAQRSVGVVKKGKTRHCGLPSRVYAKIPPQPNRSHEPISQLAASLDWRTEPQSSFVMKNVVKNVRHRNGR